MIEILYYGFLLLVVLASAFLTTLAYFAMRYVWKRRSKSTLWPRRPEGWPLAIRLARAILSFGQVPEEARPFIVSTADCQNCKGSRRLPRWTVSDAHRYLSEQTLAKALVEQELCLACLRGLAALKRMPDSVVDPPAKADVKKSSVGKRIAAAFGLMQVPGLIVWAVGIAVAAIVYLPSYYPALAYFTAGMMLIFAGFLVCVCVWLVKILFKG